MRENFSVAEAVMVQTVRNPYDVYRKAEKKNLAGKDLEVAVLVKGARLLRECQKNWEDVYAEAAPYPTCRSMQI